MQVAALRVLADEGALHLLPPLTQSPGGPAPYLCGSLRGGRPPEAVLQLWLELLGNGALERSLATGSAAADIVLFHVTHYLFGPRQSEAGEWWCLL